jgi:hypothetical protein
VLTTGERQKSVYPLISAHSSIGERQKAASTYTKIVVYANEIPLPFQFTKVLISSDRTAQLAPLTSQQLPTNYGTGHNNR